MNDELNAKNSVNQPAAEAQPASNEVLTPEAQQPMTDPIEAPAEVPAEPEVKEPAEAGTFTPPVAGMVPTGWAFPQDLASSLAMTTEDPEVASTGVDEVNQPVDDMDAGGPSEDLPESAKKKSGKILEEFDFGEMGGDEVDDLRGLEEEPEEEEEEEEEEESEDDCESCEELEENPEEIPDLLDMIADILRKKDLEDEDSDELEDETESEDEEGEDFPEEDLEMDEAVKYPAGSKPRQSTVVGDIEELPKTSFDQDDIIRQYEKRALARKALIEKLKKPLWEKELDEIADTDERDKEVGYKSIDDAIDEGSLSEKFDRALKNPLEESRKGATGWAAHNNLGRLSERRLDFKKMVGKGFLD